MKQVGFVYIFCCLKCRLIQSKPNKITFIAEYGSSENNKSANDKIQQNKIKMNIEDADTAYAEVDDKTKNKLQEDVYTPVKKKLAPKQIDDVYTEVKKHDKNSDVYATVNKSKK